MSIAVSLTVQPSRLLRRALHLLCASILLINLIFVSVNAERLSPLVATLLVLLGGFAVFVGLYHDKRFRKILHIEIAGNGSIRVAEHRPTPTCTTPDWPHFHNEMPPVRLLPNSTLWPQLLLLRLRDDGGNLITIPVLPDCLNRDDFRALAVACRWCARHGVQEKQNPPAFPQ